MFCTIWQRKIQQILCKMRKRVTSWFSAINSSYNNLIYTAYRIWNNQNRFHNTRSKFKTHSVYKKLLIKPLIKQYSKYHYYKTYPINTNRNIAAVIRAPLEAGDNIPNMAKTEIYNIIYRWYKVGQHSIYFSMIILLNFEGVLTVSFFSFPYFHKGI